MNMEDVISESNESFSSAEIHENDGISGYPEVSPRIGADYQAEIPPLLTESDGGQLMRKSSKFCIRTDAVTWAPEENRNRMDEVTSLGVSAKNKVVPLKASDYEKSSKFEASHYVEDHIYPFPESQIESWNDNEKSSFLLGLYIFGKNLAVVERFVGSKTMGEVLSYYYGKFYGSTDYRKWSDGRNSKRKRRSHGLKILRGWRRRELLSRLSSHVSQEGQNVLTEVSRMFDEGKITLEEYVFSLKDTVGLNMLEEAIAIGKGKRDLTGTSMEPRKANRSLPVRADIPVGKACSFLTPGEIIKILTGDCRLSKTRANDLFYEAVWPRLLASGWQSEQPQNGGSKHSVVYLAPGIQKFSRELLKGYEYFDSVSDILNKVASEPELLELEAVQDKEELEGDTLNSPTEQEPEILSEREHHSFLQPPNVGCNRYSMKFTVVDTSLASEGECWKVRKLRRLPCGSMNKSTLSHSSNGRNFSKDLAESVTETELSADLASSGTNLVKDQFPKDSIQMILPVENHDDLNTNILSDRKSRMTMNVKFSMNDPSTNVSEQHSLSPCSYRELNQAAGNILAEESGFRSNLADNHSAALEISENSLSSPLAGGYEGSSEKDFPNGAFLEKSGLQIVIDLNIPFAPPSSGPEEKHVAYQMQSDSNFSAEDKIHSDTSNTVHAEASIQQQAVTNGRRQSTRNRPTTKALEAIAYGFLDTRRKRKAVDSISQDHPIPETSRRVRAKTTDHRTLNNAVGNVA